MRLSSISILALTAALSFGGFAVAQDAPPPPPAAHQGWDRDAMHKRMEEHVAAHVKLIHDALNIRPDQEAAFGALVAAMHPAHAGHEGLEGMHHEGMEGMHHDAMGEDHADMAAMSTPERLDLMARKMDERAARMREHMQSVIGAVKSFYAVLSPEQRHTFDALSLMMMGHAHEMGGMGHEHGEMGEMGHGPMQGDHDH